MKGASKQGKWQNTHYSKHNRALCEKPQTINIDKLSKMFFELKNQFQVEKRELKDTIAVLEKKNNELDRKVTKLETNIQQGTGISVSNNSVYVQYPYELEPVYLWNCSKNGAWKDISNKYANMFFRVNGDKSTFGQVQKENVPRIDRVKWICCSASDSSCNSDLGDYEIVLGDWSHRVLTGYVYSNGGAIAYRFQHQYHNSGGEVRPQNMAIKIWKCIE